MDFNQLPIFASVVESQSISAAARQLGIPKSTVSRAIAALEVSCEIQLFHRTTRAVELTPAGRTLYERARPLVSSLRELAGSLPETDEVPSGELRVTVPPDIAVTWLPRVSAEFSRRYPRVQLHIFPTMRPVDLVREGFDICLRVARKLADSSLVARRLSTITAGVYAAPVYLARCGTPKTLEDLVDHDWVTFSKAPLIAELPRTGRTRVSSDDLLFLCAAMKQGLGVGFLPTFLGQQGVLTGELLRVIPTWEQEVTSLFLVHPYHGHVPSRVTAFREFVVSSLAIYPLRLSK